MFADTRLIRYLPTVILPAIWVTLKIIFFSAVISITLGLLLGILLVVTEPDGLKPNKVFHSVLGKVTDVIRSFPTIVLIVAVAPLTRLLIGTTIGANAAIFAITLACTPYATRMTENALHTVDEQLIEAAKSFGATKLQIITKVMMVEALPQLVANFTIMLINMLNVSAMAGAVGAGGLGAVALTYGYQRFDYAIMYFIVAILIVLVLQIQGISNLLYKKLK